MTPLLLLALAAPAPPHRPRADPVPQGEYRMVWGGHPYRAAFHRDGYCEFDGGRWVGTWTLQGRTLRVTEQTPGGEKFYTWSVELQPGTLSGTLDGGRRFSLTRE